MQDGEQNRILAGSEEGAVNGLSGVFSSFLRDGVIRSRFRGCSPGGKDLGVLRSERNVGLRGGSKKMEEEI